VSVESGETLAAVVADEPDDDAQLTDEHDPLVPPGLVRGPYKAETFPVTIQQQYVVVDVGAARKS
jgi:hypothetical protein